ncbi:SIS domain-containing protein [Halosimplex aquaticum]|uniref:SIS domain-containing protein n=1 Tax=Halosimplex aquaticum TaxID=3026162 RepID=A0ABD5Y298_9EURY|nr:SIS domain-containing protein [Halosimplex aquaticum]
MIGEQSNAAISEGCDVVDRTLSARAAIEPLGDAVAAAREVFFLGCGSSYWTGEIGSYLLAAAGVPARAEYASEFRHADPPVDEETLVVALSQSGETTETVAALERAGRRGAETAAITNTAGSTLDERAERTYVTPAGREEAVMATKTVDAAVAALYLLADRFRDGGPDLSAVGERCREALTVDLSGAVSAITATDRLYALGTGPFHGVAGEAATKFAEATRHHATPLSTLEITHGPIANSDGSAVLVFALTGDRAVYRHVLERLTDAGAETVVFRPADESYAATETIAVGRPVETALPALKLVQRLAYEGAVELGRDPDDPPELSKHVEVPAIAGQNRT